MPSACIQGKLEEISWISGGHTPRRHWGGSTFPHSTQASPGRCRCFLRPLPCGCRSEGDGGEGGDRPSSISIRSSLPGVVGGDIGDIGDDGGMCVLEGELSDGHVGGCGRGGS